MMPGSMKWRHWVALVGLSSALLSAAFIGRAKALPQGNPSLLVKTVSPITLPIQLIPPASKVRKTENLSTLFSEGGVRRVTQAKIIDAFLRIYPHPLYEGQRYLLTTGPDSTLSEFLLWSKTGDCEYAVSPLGGDFQAVSRPSSFSKYTITLSGTIENSLYAALLAQGEGAELINQFVDLFSWDINWFLDPKPGDRYSLVIEKFYRQSEFMGYGKILAASYLNGDRPHTAFYFAPDSGAAGYYNNEGASMRKTFLKAPLSYSRISSKFNLRRLHPILHSYRAHAGVDYAAPMGTPVKAAADGRVISMGYKGGLGNLVTLAHGNSYTSGYGHLKLIDPSMRLGKTVRQGEIVGYVGSTGLSTGPHLHYQLSRHGRTLDPLKADFPSVTQIPEGRFAEFQTFKARLCRRLNIDGDLYARR